MGGKLLWSACVGMRRQVHAASPPACCPQLLADMERCARALARSVGYVGAATVEFLYIMETQQYCFLELNPRLQVRGAVRCGPVRWWAGG